MMYILSLVSLIAEIIHKYVKTKLEQGKARCIQRNREAWAVFKNNVIRAWAAVRRAVLKNKVTRAWDVLKNKVIRVWAAVQRIVLKNKVTPE